MITSATTRFSKDPPQEYDTIVFIGNGCICNGWSPLSEVLTVLFKKIPQLDLFDVLPHDPISILLQLVTKERNCIRTLTNSFLEECPQFRVNFPKNRTTDSTLQQALDNLTCIQKIRYEISKTFAIRSRDNTLSLQIKDNLAYQLEKTSTLVITTNWDRLIFDNMNIQNVIQLHRLCSQREDDPLSHTLVLPTELKHDTFHFFSTFEQPFRSLCQKIGNDQLFNMFNFKTDRLLQSHFDTHILNKEGAVNKIKKIIVAGIKFNDYDTELVDHLDILRGARQAVINDGGEYIEELHIINPDIKAANRAHFFLRGIANRVIQTNPRNDIDTIIYS